MDFRDADVLEEQVQGFGGVEVIVQLAMVADAGEGESVDIAPLPELAQAAQADVGVATHEPYQFGSGGDRTRQLMTMQVMLHLRLLSEEPTAIPGRSHDVLDDRRAEIEITRMRRARLRLGSGNSVLRQRLGLVNAFLGHLPCFGSFECLHVL